MLELITKPPLTIEGDPLSRANINLDYRLKNVPVAKIRNKKMAQKKARWDLTNVYKDQIALMLRSERNKHGWDVAKRPLKVFINLMLVFPSKEHDDPAMVRRDLDNVEKLIYDAVSASDVIEDDMQIIHKLVGKGVSRNNPRLEIYSLAITDTAKDFPAWLIKQAEILMDLPQYSITLK